jgi:hypothetical protein
MNIANDMTELVGKTPLVMLLNSSTSLMELMHLLV